MRRKQLNLRALHNSFCVQKCNKQERSLITEDGMCRKTVSVVDKLPLRCVGKWEKDKIYRLTRYFDIFATGMRKQWSGLNYIEICSGPGRCIVRETGDELDGTALSIINQDAMNFVKKAFFIDYNKEVVDILNKRIALDEKVNIGEAIECDYNDIDAIKDILSRVFDRCLNLVFVDPNDCGVPFITIKLIDEILENVDFIINVSIGTDIARNIRAAILESSHKKVRTKYVNFLGGQDYFDKENILEYAKKGNAQKLQMLFLDEYKNNLSKLGFIYLDAVPVRHLYYLLFASKHPTGLRFWKEACRIQPNGQRTFKFSD